MSGRTFLFPALSVVSTLLACGSYAFNGGQQGAGLSCTDDSQCAPGKETCDVARKACTPIPPASELGPGFFNDTATTEIYTSQGADLVDLAFHGDAPTQLWAVSYKDDRVHVGFNVGPEPGSWRSLKDPASIHFMHKPPAIAWGEGGLWATCSDTDNAQNDPRGAGEPNYFMGPALFTSDLAIFAKQNPAVGLNLGSHVDMLHNTSFCRGIAHVEANWFWVFNGELGSLDKYNFAAPHDPGADDHSDGEIYRYAEGQVKGVEGVPSHLAYDPDDKLLYVADTGNKRVVRLDTSAGTLGERLPRRNELLAKSGIMTGTNVEVVVPPGTLEQPSGLEFRNGSVYVSDAATSTFFVFDKTGKELRRLATGLPPGSLAGFTFGVDNKLWFVDRLRGKILRVDPVAK